jgi:hypothetical protein
MVPFYTLKLVNGTFRIEEDQRAIIRFLWNEVIDAYEITRRFQGQFDEHASALRTVRFWIAEVRFARQDLYDEIRSGRPPRDDLDAKIMAILHKIPFESARSIAETLSVASLTVLLYLNDSIGFGCFHLYLRPHLLTHDLSEKRKEYLKRCCHSCLLPNAIVGIIL